MRVRATRLGHSGQARVREGTVFVLPAGEKFNPKWMEEVADAPAAPPATTRPDDQKPLSGKKAKPKREDPPADAPAAPPA